jgi:hypothetical protein
MLLLQKYKLAHMLQAGYAMYAVHMYALRGSHWQGIAAACAMHETQLYELYAQADDVIIQRIT